MPRPTRSFSAPTDRQRLLISRELPSSTIPDHRQHFALPSKPKGPPAPAGTLAIYGKDGTYICLDFGAGRMAGTIHLSTYMAPYKLPLLSNHMYNLVGKLPDAIGLDISLAAGADLNLGFISGGFSGLAGINFIWHTRGDAHAEWPEVHLYHGYSANASRGSILDTLSSLTSPVNLSGAAQLVLGWARFHDKDGNGYPAPNSWVANGYNWTGKFYSIGASIPVYGYASLVGSYFQSIPLFDDLEKAKMWCGISIGVGVSAKIKKVTGLTSKTGLKETRTIIKPDLANIFKNFGWHKFKNLGLGQSETNYSLVYANGGDYIPANKDTGQPDRPITGGSFPGTNQVDDN